MSTTTVGLRTLRQAVSPAVTHSPTDARAHGRGVGKGALAAFWSAVIAFCIGSWAFIGYLTVLTYRALSA